MGDNEQYQPAGEDRQLPGWVDEQAADDYTGWEQHPDLYAAAVREAGDPAMFFGYEAPPWQSTKEPGPGMPPGVARSVPATDHLYPIPPDLSSDPNGPTFGPDSGYELVELGEANSQPSPLSGSRPDARSDTYSSSEFYTSPQFDNGNWENEDNWEDYVDDLREEVGDSPRFVEPHPPLFLFEPGRRDIDVMWRWLRGMQPGEIRTRADGWERIASVLASAEGTLRSRGRALRDAWHSAVDDQSAANNFLHAVGGTMWSMSWWWHLAHVMKTDLRTIASAIDEAREQLGPVYAHYQVALALWNNWDQLSQLPDGTELYINGTHIDGYELPRPGTMSVDSHHQRFGDAPAGPDSRMRINDPSHADWHPGLPVLYDQSNGGSTDKDITSREDILEAYHQRAAEVVQPLANLYNDTHAWMPTQDAFRGPNPQDLALPLDPSDVDPAALIDRLGGPGAFGVPSMPSMGSMPSVPSVPGSLGPGAMPVAVPAGAGLPSPVALPIPAGGGDLAGGPAVAPVSIPPIGAAPPMVSPPGASPVPPVIPPIVPGFPTAPGAGLPGGSGAPGTAQVPVPGVSPGGAQVPGVIPPGAGPGVTLPGVTAPGGAGVSLPANVPGSVPGAVPGLAPGVPGAVPGVAPGVPGTAPVAAPFSVVPGGLAPGFTAPGVDTVGVSVPVQGGAALPGVTASVSGAAGLTDAQAMGMMPPPPPPLVPPLAGSQQGGQRSSSQAATPAGMPPPPSPLFVPPGRVSSAGRAPTAPQRIPPTLAGASAKPARTARLSGVQATSATQRQEPAQQARKPETVTVPGEHDQELWTVKKPKRLLQGAPPPGPAKQGKPIGAA